jgi:hypothetical protein
MDPSSNPSSSVQVTSAEEDKKGKNVVVASDNEEWKEDPKRLVEGLELGRTERATQKLLESGPQITIPANGRDIYAPTQLGDLGKGNECT